MEMPNVATNGKLGAIACPPQLIVTPPTDHTLHLLHYEADQTMRLEAWWTSTGPAPDPVPFPLRARLTKSTLDPRTRVSIIQQGGGISPGSFS